MSKKNTQKSSSHQGISIYGKNGVMLSCIVLFYMICCVSIGFAGETNGYDLILNAFEKVTSEEDAGVEEIFHKDWVKPLGLTKKELADLEIWVNDNQESLQIFDQALQKKQWIHPVVNLETLNSIPSFTKARNLARIKMAHGRLAIEKGNLSQGVNDFLSVVTYGNRFRDFERGNLVSMMIGIAIQKTALNGLEDVCINYSPNEAVLVKILNFIPVQKQPDDQFIKAVRGERDNFALPITEKLKKEIYAVLDQLDMPYQPIFDIEESKKIINLQFSFFIENAKCPWAKRQIWPPKEWREHEKEISQLREKLIKDLSIEKNIFGDDIGQKLHFTDFDLQNVEHVKAWQRLEKYTREMNNVVGRYLLVGEVSDFSPYYERSIMVRTSLNRLKNLAAILLYEQRLGKWPQQLQHLVDTKILLDLPQDLFAAGPFHYSVEKGLLWSVGPDGDDNGGDSETDLILFLSGEGNSQARDKIKE
ncbi:hypothetical protein [Desulfogranum japonicum]|uniref:hypothetical protein n=1 Tax=Desulfogranum japonicum TaxID=231447 RepID=UPI00040C31D8|nr:hypothetical protein [Desulfogranum japonicum]